jgi:hypothetical protein
MIENLLINCTAAIPNMEADDAAQPIAKVSSFRLHQLQYNELYADGHAVHDDLSKHGLIFAELLNGVAGSDASAVSLVVEGIFVLNCHSAVGSALTVSGLTMEL